MPDPHRAQFGDTVFCISPARRGKSSYQPHFCGRRPDNDREVCTCRYTQSTGKRCLHLWAMATYQLCGSVASFEENASRVYAFIKRTGRSSSRKEKRPDVGADDDRSDFRKFWGHDFASASLPKLDKVDLNVRAQRTKSSAVSRPKALSVKDGGRSGNAEHGTPVRDTSPIRRRFQNLREDISRDSQEPSDAKAAVEDPRTWSHSLRGRPSAIKPLNPGRSNAPRSTVASRTIRNQSPDTTPLSVPDKSHASRPKKASKSIRTPSMRPAPVSVPLQSSPDPFRPSTNLPSSVGNDGLASPDSNAIDSRPKQKTDEDNLQPLADPSRLALPKPQRSSLTIVHRKPVERIIQQHQPIGVINTGVDCYALALLQVLLRLDNWSGALYTPRSPVFTSDPIVKLVKAFRDSLDGEQPASFPHLRQALFGRSMRYRMWHLTECSAADLVESAERQIDPDDLLAQINAHLDTASSDKGFSRSMQFTVISVVECSHCHDPHVVREECGARRSIFLRLGEDGGERSIEDLVADGLQVGELRDHECLATCEATSPGVASTFRAKSDSYLVNGPPVLHLNLNWPFFVRKAPKTRSMGLASDADTVEIDTRVGNGVHIPYRLSLVATFRPGPPPPISYTLRGIVCRIGRTASEGHYIAIVGSRHSWWVIDDDRVSHTSSPSDAAFEAGRYPVHVFYEIEANGDKRAGDNDKTASTKAALLRNKSCIEGDMPFSRSTAIPRPSNHSAPQLPADLYFGGKKALFGDPLTGSARQPPSPPSTPPRNRTEYRNSSSPHRVAKPADKDDNQPAEAKAPVARSPTATPLNIIKRFAPSRASISSVGSLLSFRVFPPQIPTSIPAKRSRSSSPEYIDLTGRSKGGAVWSRTGAEWSSPDPVSSKSRTVPVGQMGRIIELPSESEQASSMWFEPLSMPSPSSWTGPTSIPSPGMLSTQHSSMPSPPPSAIIDSELPLDPVLKSLRLSPPDIASIPQMQSSMPISSMPQHLMPPVAPSSQISMLVSTSTLAEFSSSQPPISAPIPPSSQMLSPPSEMFSTSPWTLTTSSMPPSILPSIESPSQGPMALPVLPPTGPGLPPRSSLPPFGPQPPPGPEVYTPIPLGPSAQPIHVASSNWADISASLPSGPVGPPPPAWPTLLNLIDTDVVASQKKSRRPISDSLMSRLFRGDAARPGRYPVQPASQPQALHNLAEKPAKTTPAPMQPPKAPSASLQAVEEVSTNGSTAKKASQSTTELDIVPSQNRATRLPSPAAVATAVAVAESLRLEVSHSASTGPGQSPSSTSRPLSIPVQEIGDSTTRSAPGSPFSFDQWLEEEPYNGFVDTHVAAQVESSATHAWAISQEVSATLEESDSAYIAKPIIPAGASASQTVSLAQGESEELSGLVSINVDDIGPVDPDPSTISKIDQQAISTSQTIPSSRDESSTVPDFPSTIQEALGHATPTVADAIDISSPAPHFANLQPHAGDAVVDLTSSASPEPPYRKAQIHFPDFPQVEPAPVLKFPFRHPAPGEHSVDFGGDAVQQALNRYSQVVWAGSATNLDLISMLAPSGRLVRPTFAPGFFATLIERLSSHQDINLGIRTRNTGVELSVESFRRMITRNEWWNTSIIDSICLSAVDKLKRSGSEWVARCRFVEFFLRWDSAGSAHRPALGNDSRSRRKPPWLALGMDQSWRGVITVAVINVEYQTHFATVAIFGPARLVIPFDGFGGDADNHLLSEVSAHMT